MIKLLVITYMIAIGDGGAAVDKVEYSFKTMQECQATAAIFKKNEIINLDDKWRTVQIVNRAYCIKQEGL